MQISVRLAHTIKHELSVSHSCYDEDAKDGSNLQVDVGVCETKAHG